MRVTEVIAALLTVFFAVTFLNGSALAEEDDVVVEVVSVEIDEIDTPPVEAAPPEFEVDEGEANEGAKD
jgi:hypothetical protein